MRRKIILTIILLSSIMGCALLCMQVVSITPAWMEYQVRRTAATLPRPAGTELLLERFRNVSGSSCRAVAYYQVYGSHTPQEVAVASFLHALSEAGWREQKVDESQYLPRFRGKIVGCFQKGSYRLFLHWADLQEVVISTGAYRQQAELMSQAKMFKAFLMVELYLIGPCID